MPHGRAGSPIQGRFKVLGGLELELLVPIRVVVKTPSRLSWAMEEGGQLETARSESPRLVVLMWGTVSGGEDTLWGPEKAQ